MDIWQDLVIEVVVIFEDEILEFPSDKCIFPKTSHDFE